ncbi:MAG TPA: hypothetical protein VMB82_09620, partial [Acidimicrobiales bacterium]|nr:hypothetical protein [Acidimicrobiales bacterium]
MTITITDVPTGLSADVQVRAGDHLVATLRSSETINPARPGKWTITALPLHGADDTYFPVVEKTKVKLGAGAHGAVDVDYGQVVSSTTVVAPSKSVESIGTPNSNG